jgi:NAD(P)-dependent dehydrogenase (short-subunit alcohol dehydrogenase family)
MPCVLVTGSNRGLGLEWVRQYASEGWRVYATCRFPCEAEELRNLADRDEKISIHRMDVTCTDQINAVSIELLKQPIDLLVSNAGVYLEKYRKTSLGGINYDDWRYSFEVNTLGHIRVMESFLPDLRILEKKMLPNPVELKIGEQYVLSMQI